MQNSKLFLPISFIKRRRQFPMPLRFPFHGYKNVICKRAIHLRKNRHCLNCPSCRFSLFLPAKHRLNVGSNIPLNSNFTFCHGVTVICVSPWYVYPRIHIPSDMCIPPIWLPVKCVSPTPHPSKQVSVFISVVFVNSTNHRQRDYKWFNITNNTIDKRATIRDKIIAKLSLASLLLRGPQCWCKHSFSLLSLSNVIIIHMSLVALNKYDWQNFIQQGITRKVKK